jgi:hypothetical protein
MLIRASVNGDAGLRLEPMAKMRTARTSGPSEHLERPRHINMRLDVFTEVTPLRRVYVSAPAQPMPPAAVICHYTQNPTQRRFRNGGLSMGRGRHERV